MLFLRTTTSSSSGSTANGSQYEAASMCRGKSVRHGRVSAACLKMPGDRPDLSAKDLIRYNQFPPSHATPSSGLTGRTGQKTHTVHDGTRYPKSQTARERPQYQKLLAAVPSTFAARARRICRGVVSTLLRTGEYGSGHATCAFWSPPS